MQLRMTCLNVCCGNMDNGLRNVLGHVVETSIVIKLLKRTKNGHIKSIIALKSKASMPINGVCLLLVLSSSAVPILRLRAFCT